VLSSRHVVSTAAAEATAAREASDAAAAEAGT
jgi:hypothetical protein